MKKGIWLGITYLGVCLSLLTATTVVFALNDKTQEKIEVLLNKLHLAAEQENALGQTINTDRGKIFAGQSAEKMAKLHEEVQKEIDDLIARPEALREKAVSNIKDFTGKADFPVQYRFTSRSSYDSKVPAEIYYVGADQYEVDARNNEIIQFGPRPLAANEAPKEYATTARHTKEELEAKALSFIAGHTKVDLTALTPSSGDKDGINYFFRWEDRSKETQDMYPFIQVGLTSGGEVVSYTNSLGVMKQ